MAQIANHHRYMGQGSIQPERREREREDAREREGKRERARCRQEQLLLSCG